VASVIGIGGFVGAMASMLFQRYTGAILDASHGSYVIIFRFCGLAYIVALALFQALTRKVSTDGGGPGSVLSDDAH
jgi:ACS family hexuronate transporter-like MFS transporter